MDILIQALILIGGLILILLGANYLVDGSSSIAKKFGLSEFVIGLTIVGIGTSSPEMVVSFMSAIQGKAEMAIGNVVGSNIFNTLVILGITAAIFAVPVKENTLKIEIPFLALISILLPVLGLDGKVTFVDGIILWAAFIVYFIYLIVMAKKGRSVVEEEEIDGSKPWWKLILFAIVVAPRGKHFVEFRMFGLKHFHLTFNHISLHFERRNLI